MGTLSSVPIIDVYLAFDVTTSGNTLDTAYSVALPASGASNTYWTNISQYVQDFKKRSGIQHALDRMEAGTLQLTLDGRDGFFFNGTLNGSGTIIAARQAVAVTIKWPLSGGTTYRKFLGFIDTVTEKNKDINNVELQVDCSDQLKMLSLRYMDNPDLWASYTTGAASAVAYYSLSPTRTAIVTQAVGSGTTITYTGFNDFLVGDTITIVGLGIFSGASLNLVNVVVASATAYQFTVTSGTTGIASGSGSAYRSRMVDSIGANNALIKGTASFPNNGAIIYVANACVDLANGSSSATAYLNMPHYTTTQGGIDFWVLGQGISNSLLMLNLTTSISGVDQALNFGVNSTGHPFVEVLSVSSTVVTATIKIDDGYWHHVGLVSDISGHLQLYVDGTYFSMSSIATCTGFKSSTNATIGNTSTNLGAPAMSVDEIVVSSTSHLSGLYVEVQNRYVAGTLLQLPTNPAGSAVLSGDRIAEILTVAGYGSVVNGAIQLNSNLYFINNGSAWVKGVSTNGKYYCQPWYWDSPVYDSTALDLIYEVCDTESGRYLQRNDGTFGFYTQAFYGTWAWSAGAGTWTPNSYSPDTHHSFDDVGTDTPYLGDELELLRDDTETWTVVRVTPQAGTEQVFQAASSVIKKLGMTTLVLGGTVHVSLDAALSTANYLGHIYRGPLPRVQGMPISSSMGNGDYNASLCTVAVADVVHFVRTPNNGPDGVVSRNMVVLSEDLDYSKADAELKGTYLLDPYLIRT